MRTHAPAARFAGPRIALHWIMALLFVAVFASIELRVLFAKGTELREAFKGWHFALGMLVLPLLALRLAARIGRPAPAITPPPPAWQQSAATALHLALYAWMLAMPVAGWCLRNAEGHAVLLLGLQMPTLLLPDKALAKEVRHWHELAGQVGYGLIALHVLAALVHHVVQRDSTLRRMWPAVRRGEPA